MINLPDVIPSMIYDDTNAYSSLFVSCGKEIPGVTGQALYQSRADNPRLGRSEFIMPILYRAARDICAAQHRALAQGNCLVVYQTFRPKTAQKAVVKGLSALAEADPEVMAAITTPPWSMTWFISTGVSNHQRGIAMDVSMVKVLRAETVSAGGYPHIRAVEWQDYEMPTAMHELSMAAASTLGPNSAELSPTMNAPAIALRKFFTDSGMTPLASEWWHFNHNAAKRATQSRPSDGAYLIQKCFSVSPEAAAGL